MSEPKEICIVCKQSAVQKCSDCKEVYYCSREHQKLHWKEHSKKCKSFRLAEDSKVGRHYVAKRKIEIGEIVMKDEEAIVAGPMYGSVPVCLSCYTPLDSNCAKPCEKCGWPLCQDCTAHGPECEFTINYKGTKISITEFGYPHPTYRCVSVIRAICLAKTNLDAYRRLLNMQDHCDKVINGTDITYDDCRGVARFIKTFFQFNDVGEDEIAKIAGILQVNGHEVPITEPPYMAVYDSISYTEHNCRANCSKSFTNNGGLIVRAALPIVKGDHISICYTDPLWGVTNRRHHLARTKFFDCTCERCTDPTEFGTMFNAVKCRKRNCSGNALPPTFLDEQTKSLDYICDNCKCTTRPDEIETMLEKIGIDISEMKKNDIKACKSFIADNATVLHENHFYNTDIKLALAQIIGQEIGGLPAVDDELLKEKITLCKKLNDLFCLLIPAENRVRGLLLFEMHAAVAEFGRRQGRDELLGHLVESKRILKEAYRLLQFEPDVLPEGKIAHQAQRNLQEINVIIKTLCKSSMTPV